MITNDYVHQLGRNAKTVSERKSLPCQKGRRWGLVKAELGWTLRSNWDVQNYEIVLLKT